MLTATWIKWTDHLGRILVTLLLLAAACFCWKAPESPAEAARRVPRGPSQREAAVLAALVILILLWCTM